MRLHEIFCLFCQPEIYISSTERLTLFSTSHNRGKTLPVALFCGTGRVVKGGGEGIQIEEDGNCNLIVTRPMNYYALGIVKIQHYFRVNCTLFAPEGCRLRADEQPARSHHHEITFKVLELTKIVSLSLTEIKLSSRGGLLGAYNSLFIATN